MALRAASRSAGDLAGTRMRQVGHRGWGDLGVRPGTWTRKPI